MIANKVYRITAKVKLHTSPLTVLEYEKIGRYLYSTKSYHCFEGFKIRKTNVLNTMLIAER